MSATSVFIDCDFCQKKEKTIDAVTFCTKCRQFYCQPCAERHQGMKITKYHNQVIVRNVKTFLDLRPYTCEVCDESTVATAVCVECKEVYCSECEEYHKCLKECKDHTLMKISTNVKVNESTNESSSENATTDLPTKQRPTPSALIMTQLENINLEPSEFNNIPIRTKQQTVSSAVMLTEAYESTLPRLPSYEEATACGFAKSRSYLPQSSAVTMHANQFPLLNEKLMDDRLDQTHAVPTYQGSVRSSNKQSSSLSAEYLTKFCVRLLNDEKSCDINSIVSLPGGLIVLVDSKNKKLKLVSTSSYTVTSAIDIPAKGKTVAIWDNNTVALAVDTCIKFYRVDEHGNLQMLPNLISIAYQICDIARYDDCFVCLCSRKKSFSSGCLVKVHCDGKTEIIAENALTKMTSNFLAVYQPADIIIVGSYDDKRNQIRCFSFKGKPRWSVPFKYFTKGIAITDGHILVAEYAKHSIHRVSCDGNLDPTPLIFDDDRIRHPHALAVQERHGTLIISNHSNDNDNVMVYNLTRK